jgi:hypothetical protein
MEDTVLSSALAKIGFFLERANSLINNKKFHEALNGSK